jgi:DNA-binding transcriptional MerR regulator
LLKPSRVAGNGYRQYDTLAVVRLQQILFYKELGLSLKAIKALLDTSGFDVLAALEAHKGELERKAGRMLELLETIENTIQHLKGKRPMSDADFFKGFDEAQQKEYEQEVIARWGADNPAYKQSKQRWGSYSEAYKAEIIVEGQAITLGLVEHIDEAPTDPEVQALVARQHQWVNRFWDCSLEQFAGLGEGYATDPQFATTYQGFHPALPEFLFKAIQHYVKSNQ